MHHESSAARRVAWVIGGGSGIGAATSEFLASHGWHVVVSGRRSRPLEEVVSRIDRDGGCATPRPGDISTPEVAQHAARDAFEVSGRLDAVIHCAGTNQARRTWAEASPAGFRDIVSANFLSSSYAVMSALPYLRSGSGGNIVLVSSWAGRRHLGRVGPAYASSKAALGPLVDSLNDEEGPNGIRATLLVPGEVATELIARGPSAPSDRELADMLQPEDVARVVRFVLEQPPGVCVPEVVVAPTNNRLFGPIAVNTRRLG